MVLANGAKSLGKRHYSSAPLDPASRAQMSITYCDPAFTLLQNGRIMSL